MKNGATMQVRKPFLTSFTEAEQKDFLDDLNYLNMAEIKSFCRAHSIPFAIHVESTHGKRRSEMDRKGVILNRIRHFLKTGEVLPPTCFAATVVCFDRFAKQLSPDDRLFYGQYDRENRAALSLLKRLTEGKFRDGAVARIVAREFWSRGEAPTFRQYAAAWLDAAGKDGERTRNGLFWQIGRGERRGRIGSTCARRRQREL